jgi:hypothetical protein
VQICRREPLSEPAVSLCEQGPGIRLLSLRLPQPAQAHHRSQRQGVGALRSGGWHCLQKAGSCARCIRMRAGSWHRVLSRTSPFGPVALRFPRRSPFPAPAAGSRQARPRANQRPAPHHEVRSGPDNVLLTRCWGSRSGCPPRSSRRRLAAGRPLRRRGSLWQSLHRGSSGRSPGLPSPPPLLGRNR